LKNIVSINKGNQEDLTTTEPTEIDEHAHKDAYPWYNKKSDEI